MRQPRRKNLKKVRNCSEEATNTEQEGWRGRGHGKLKAVTIRKLTAYYGKAIRAHPHHLDAMQAAVFATFYHASSTDAKPDHNKVDSVLWQGYPCSSASP